MKTVNLTFALDVKVEARDKVIQRGHWRNGSLSAQGLRTENRDWVTEDVPPLTYAQLVREVRRSLNEMWRDTGLSSSDFEFTIVRVSGGRKQRRKQPKS